MLSWLICRQVMQRFGLSYYYRIRLYLDYYIATLGLMVAYLFYLLVSGSNLDYIAIALFVYDTALISAGGILVVIVTLPD